MRRPCGNDIARAAAVLLLWTGSVFAQAQVGESFGVSLDPGKKSARQFHGGFYHLFRSDALDARSFFASRVEPYRYQDFRFALTGPFLVPRLINRSRQNWFFAWGSGWNGEARRETRRSTVPTAAERNGDFRASSLCTDAFRAQFAECAVPGSAWSRLGAQLLAPYPLPNTTGGAFNLIRNETRRSEVWQHTGRLEYAPAGRWKASFRLAHEVAWQRLPFQGSALGNAPVARRRSSQSASLRLNIAQDPKTVNAFSISGTRNGQADHSLAPLLIQPGAASQAPELLPQGPSSGRLATGLPAVSIAGLTGYSAGRWPGFSQSTLTVRDDYSRVSGKHELKFGAQWMRSVRRQEIASVPSGALSFSTQGANSTGNPLADVLLGRFFSYQKGWALPLALLYQQLDLALAHKWKLRPRFVLEYGLAWAWMPAEYSRRGQLANFLPQRFDPGRAPQVERDGTLAEGWGDSWNGIVRAGADAPRGLYRPGHGNFAPRAGLSWQPFQKRKLTLRAGGAISFDRTRTDPALAANPPWETTTYLAGTLENPVSGRKAASRPPPLVAIHPDFRYPTVYSGTVRVEQELRPHTLAGEYKFALGRHLLRQRNLNQLPPGALLAADGIHPDALRPFAGYSTITWREAAGNSGFHALELSAVSRRPIAGLTYNLRYTFSKVLTDSTEEGEFPQDHFNLRNDRGPAVFDCRHRLVLQYAYQPKVGNWLPAWAGRLLRNWEIAGISTFTTGRPFNLTQPGDQARMGGGVQRPDALASPQLVRGQRSLDRYFNTEVFRSPALGSLGNAARYLLFGPGTNNFNLSLARTLELSKRWKGQLRGEFRNAFNHPSFDRLGTVFDPATYRLPSSTFGRVTGAGPGRSVQFTFKLVF